VDDQPDGGHTDAGLVRQRLSVGKCTPGQNVLAHGIGVASRFMVPVAELLGLYHRFYAPDLPSFGKSEKFSTASGEAFELSWLSWGVEVDRNGQHEVAASRRAYKSDFDTSLTPLRTQYGVTHGTAEIRNRLRYPGLASPVHTLATSRLSPVMSRSAIRVWSNDFTATVLQPG
jgi:pimeloyl-ACP methyl ester carboxylesterase